MQISKAYLAFGKVSPILAYAAEYMSVLIIWHRVWIAPLLVGRVSSLLPFIDELVGEGKMSSRLATCALFKEIGCISGNEEDHVDGMIVECGIGVGCRVI